MRLGNAARIAATAAVVVAVLLLGAGAVRGASVNGFNYQYQGSWHYSPIGDYYERSLALPLARRIVSYNVIDDGDLADVEPWIRDMQLRGREVMISFGADFGAAAPPSVSVYQSYVGQFFEWLDSRGIVVDEFTAWNEPNHPLNRPAGNPAPSGEVAGARLAADYFKVVDDLCQPRGCTVAGGDFRDPSIGSHPTFDSYVDNYKLQLTANGAGMPDVWAIHPYKAVNEMDFSEVNDWIQNETGGKDVWITEIGAMYCETTSGYMSDSPPLRTVATAAAYQQRRANFLAQTLPSLPTRVNRVYYHQLGHENSRAPTCTSTGGRWDSALLGDADDERPAFRSFFPNASRPQAPAVSGVAASDVTIDRATISATVSSTWIGATYQVEYGLTSAYGSVATGTVRPSGAAVAVSERLAGLRPNTTYHFRVVVTSATGTSASADQTFTTRPMPQPGGLAVVPSAGVVSLFARAPDGSLQHKRYPEAGNWSAWQGLGGNVASDPAAISVEDGHVDVYVRGGDGALHHRWYRPADGWSAWQALGGQMRGTPAPVSAGPGQLDVYVRGADDGLHHRWITPTGTWSGWEDLGGTIAGDPAPVSWGPGHTEVYARGSDNAIYRRVYDATRGWAAWEGLGGTVASDPVVVSSRPGHLDLFARGTDDSLMHRRYEDGNWHAWQSLGGTIRGTPTAITWGPGHVEVIADSPIDELCRRRLLGWSWSAWECLGGSTVAGTAVDAISLGYGHLDVYARHARSLVGHTYVLGTTLPWARFAPVLPDYDPGA